MVRPEPDALEQRIHLDVSPVSKIRPPAEGVFQKLERLKASVKLIAKGEDWSEVYANIPADTIQEEIDRIESLIYEATKDELEYRFAIGMGVETLSLGEVYHPSRDYDPTAVYWVRIHPGGPVQKVTLPGEEFPEIYELKALSAWLKDELNHRN